MWPFTKKTRTPERLPIDGPWSIDAPPAGVFLIPLLLFALVGRAYAAQTIHPYDGYTVTYPDYLILDSSAVTGPLTPLVFRNLPRDQLEGGGTLPSVGGMVIMVMAQAAGTNPSAVRTGIAAHCQNAVLSDDPPLRLECTDDKDKLIYLFTQGQAMHFVVVLECKVGDPSAQNYQKVQSSILDGLVPP